MRLPQVWSVLTGYNTLADFIPNLDLCERVAGAPPGKQRLRQRACSQSLYWRLQAEAILDVQQVVRTLGRRELHFVMVEGDFQVRFACTITIFQKHIATLGNLAMDTRVKMYPRPIFYSCEFHNIEI